MKSFVAKPNEVERKWYVVDADGKTLGRLSSEIAKVLRGKNKPIYTPHVDTGDFVIVINAEKVFLSGKKLDNKMYRWHTGYIGNLQERTARQVLESHPERLVYNAVKGMLPKNSLGASMLTKLKVHVGSEHTHQAQQPEVLDI